VEIKEVKIKSFCNDLAKTYLKGLVLGNFDSYFAKIFPSFLLGVDEGEFRAYNHSDNA
jgi:hypothetical protein